MSIFADFNKQVDLDALKKDLAEIGTKKEGGGKEFTPVPYGTHEATVVDMQMDATSTGKPRLSIKFAVLADDDCEYNNGWFWHSQVISSAFGIHKANEFLRSMETGVDVKFEDYEQYADVISAVFEHIKKEGLEYEVEYDENDKGYKECKITEVFQD